MKRCYFLASLLISGLLGGWMTDAARADTAVFTNDATLSSTNFTCEGSNLVVGSGHTLIVQGAHIFGAVTIQTNAILQSAATNLQLQQLAVATNGVVILAGGSVLTVSNSISVASNATIVCLGTNSDGPQH